MNDVAGTRSEGTPAGLPLQEPSYKQIQLNGGAVSVSYDTRKWGRPEIDRDGIISLDRLVGEGCAVIIAERVGVPSELAIDTLIEELREKHPDFAILCREKRTLNGQEISCLKYSFSANAVPMILSEYCHGGLEGTVQVRTCASAANFDQCEPDFTELMSTLTVIPPRFPRFARMFQIIRFERYVIIAAMPVLGVALFRFSTHMRWEWALLWTAVLALGIFVAGWLHFRKWRLK